MSGNTSNVLIEPVITEKSTLLSKQNKYTFYVPRNASKTLIRSAFEEVFPGRKILNVQTLCQKGHKRRTKSGFTVPKNKKKAVITIEGAKIEYFPEVS